MPATDTVPKRTRQLLDAAKAAGWTVRVGKFPGNYRIDAPCMANDVPRPEWIPERMCPA